MFVSEFNKQTETKYSIKCKKKLFKVRSKFQKIEVYESSKYGNIMMLDDCFMLTEKGNEHYHNKCISLVTKKKKNLKVLIIGGGDFGIVKKLFNKVDIKKLTIVEIDEKVIDTSMKYFPMFFNLSKKIKEKIVMVIDDGFKWMKNNKLLFDVIIIDCTDPNPIAKELYSKIFYKNVYYALKKSGLIIQQSGSPNLDKNNIINPMIKKLSEVGFENISLNSFNMPIYPSGSWSFIKGKKA